MPRRGIFLGSGLHPGAEVQRRGGWEEAGAAQGVGAPPGHCDESLKVSDQRWGLIRAAFQEHDSGMWLGRSGSQRSGAMGGHVPSEQGPERTSWNRQQGGVVTSNVSRPQCRPHRCAWTPRRPPESPPPARLASPNLLHVLSVIF